MKSKHLSSLRHSWPLWEQSRSFELGHILNCVITDSLPPDEVGYIGAHHAGCWECDLKDQSLIWSGGVYDIFGMPRGVAIARDDAVGRYAEESRAKMETLRAFAIKHNRGFTIDVEIHPIPGTARWMRLIGVPLSEDNRVVKLQGLKLAL